MGKRFVFVSGDIGGTNMMIPVAKELLAHGHSVDFVVDSAGVGYKKLISQEIGFSVGFQEESVYIDKNTDLVFISTCATALGVPKAYARAYKGICPVVFGADGLFNHGYKWRDENADYWFAINYAHAKAILNLRPGLSPEHVVVTGQPAFDSVLDLIPVRDEVRQKTRRQLGIVDDEQVFLWWSQGMPEVIEEDVNMVTAAIESIGRISKQGVFIPRVHPKLNKVRAGYVDEIHETINSCCYKNGVRLVRADTAFSEGLCLASEAIISITCTEDVKNWLMGGPPVIHNIGPLTRQWFEKDVLLSPPLYLPDLESYEALMVADNSQWDVVVQSSLDKELRQNLRHNWRAPNKRATEAVVENLVVIAEGNK